MSPAHIVAVIASTAAGIHHQAKPPPDYAAWARVAQCESGGWRVLGAAYPNSLGISAVNWARFGGRPQPVGRVNMTGRIQAIRIADRLIRAYRIPIPDQQGCAAW